MNKKKVFNYVTLIMLIFHLAACSISPKELAPIAEQNQQNLADLSENTRLLIALYEPLLKAAGQSLIYQHIGKLQQEITMIVEASMLPSPDDTWKKLFEEANFFSQQTQYLDRYQFVQSALVRGLSDAELQELKIKEGWIYSTVADSAFTPQKARDILAELDTLRNIKTDNYHFYFEEAEKKLSPYDPVLVQYRAAINGSQALFAGLKKELTTALSIASIHAQSIVEFSEAKSDISQTLKIATTDIDTKQVEAILNQLSQKYLDNPSYKKAALDILTSGIKNFVAKRF